jgi:hypothetical protein
MVRRKTLAVLLGGLIVCLAVTSWAGVPNTEFTYATGNEPDEKQLTGVQRTQGAGGQYPPVGTDPEGSICNVPDGSGTPIDECYCGWAQWGAFCDATMQLYVRDDANQPIFLYPFSDMWLESLTHVWTDGVSITSMVHCTGGTVADQSTDEQGNTQFSNAMFAGCCGEDVDIRVNGWTVQTLPYVWMNSPDMSCDTVVNLTDVVMFAGEYYAPPNLKDYCANFFYDRDVGNNHVLNLSDIVVLAQAQAASCP